MKKNGLNCREFQQVMSLVDELAVLKNVYKELITDLEKLTKQANDEQYVIITDRIGQPISERQVLL